MGRTHTYEVRVQWTGNQGSGTSRYGAYGRTHDVMVEGKETLHASADPSFRGDADLLNPDEMFVAALSQCHMLTYLALCALDSVVVTGYRDRAVGTMEVTPRGGGRFVEVHLHPTLTVSDASMLEAAVALHGRAHQDCFVAASVNFAVLHHPTVHTAGADG